MVAAPVVASAHRGDDADIFHSLARDFRMAICDRVCGDIRSASADLCVRQDAQSRAARAFFHRRFVLGICQSHTRSTLRPASADHRHPRHGAVRLVWVCLRRTFYADHVGSSARARSRYPPRGTLDMRDTSPRPRDLFYTKLSAKGVSWRRGSGLGRIYGALHGSLALSLGTGDYNPVAHMARQRTDLCKQKLLAHFVDRRYGRAWRRAPPKKTICD